MKGSLKSRSLDEFVLVLFRELFADLQDRHPTCRNSLSRDFETFESRLRSEGLSFATKTLPSLGKMFDRALDQGRLEAHPSFSKMKGSRVIPAFLQGLLSLLFDPEGLLVGEEPSVVSDLRQVFYLVYKMELPYSREEEDRVINSFLRNEEELLELELPPLEEEAKLCARVLEGLDPKDILPRHGPGAVSTGEKLEGKWQFSRLFSGIHKYYPYYEYFVAGGPREILDRIKWYRGMQRLDVGVAKVVLVPKDSRGPRLISCEPLEYQWIQQGLNSALVKHLESNELTRGFINFQDQSVNQDLARESSRHHFYSTLDLKDASDRVSLALVKKLFPEDLFPAFEAVRSHATQLPDGRVIPLAKYAPMGSAVCFSVEALCFWVICVVAVMRALKWDLSEAARHVYVYGDDLVIPSLAFDAVVDALHQAGLKVNLDKCCSCGDFRESCGVDAWKGFDVTPTRLSTRWIPEPSDGASLASYAAYANQFCRKGYYRLAAAIRIELERVHGVLPHGTETSGFPCIEESSHAKAHMANAKKRIRSRQNPALQRIEFQVKALVPIRTSSTLDDWPRLLRAHVRMAGERPDEVVLPRRTKVRKVWRPV